MKRIYIFVLCAALSATPLLAQAKPDFAPSYYAGINPVSLAMFLPRPYGLFITGFGVASGQESGLSLYGGLYAAKGQSLELRLSTGPVDQFTWESQAQIGYIWYPCESHANWSGGPLAGIMIRNFAFASGLNNQWVFNHVPELVTGWRFITRPLAIDARLGWNIASCTWSTIPYTKAGVCFNDFPYNLNIVLGIAWLFQ